MSVLQGIFLGMLQGVAEFLPVSSSGHLAVVQKLFNLGDVPLLFDVILHLATLLAVVIFFRVKIWNLLCTFGRVIYRKKDMNQEEMEVYRNDCRYIGAVIIATIITGALGIVSSKYIPFSLF